MKHIEMSSVFVFFYAYAAHSWNSNYHCVPSLSEANDVINDVDIINVHTKLIDT